MSDDGEQYQRIINSARVELENAGNPGYGVLSELNGEYFLGAMIYSALRPAMGEAERAVANAEPGETVYIVSRATEGGRVMFTLMDPASRKLHQLHEVIEKSITERDNESV